MPAVTLSEVLATSDVPGGVVNLITGLRGELVQHLAGHMDVNGLDAFGLDPAQAAEVEQLGTENVKRVARPPARGLDGYDWLSPAAQSEFSLLPAQNTSGNWVKVVQRIPMRIRLDTSDKSRPPLRAGMSVEVDVDTGHQRGLPQVLTALFARATGKS